MNVLARHQTSVWIALGLALVGVGHSWGRGGTLPAAPWEPGPEAPAPRIRDTGEIDFSLPFHESLDRVYWDQPIAPLPKQAGGIAVELSCEDPAAIRAITLYLECDGTWLAATATPAAGRQILFFSGTDFRVESDPPDWTRARRWRLSVWRGAARSATLTLHGIHADTPPIAIMAGTATTAPDEEAFAEQCAQRARRLFEKAGLLASVISDDFSRMPRRRQALLVLPYNPTLSSQQIKALERYIHRGGRVVVFYNSHARLASRLGLELRPYATQSELWTTVRWATNALPDLPNTWAQFTQHLLPVQAGSSAAVTLGYWLNPDGQMDLDRPAAAVSPRGLWYSQVPPLATASAVQWLLASLAHMDSTYIPARDRYLARQRDRNAQAAARSVPLRGSAATIHGVWAPEISSGTRAELMRQLAGCQINALMERVGSLPDNLPEHAARQKQISRAVELAHANQLQVHAWLFCWSFEGEPPLAWPADRFLQDTQGNPQAWLDPQHPANQELLQKTVATLVQLGVDGIHLDYLRYPSGAESPGTLPDSSQRDEMTALITALAQQARALNSAIRISAAVYPTPESASQLGQDWPAWLAAGAVDFVSPMLYTEDVGRFAEQLTAAIAAAPTPQHIVPGIGVSADPTQLDALALAQQIQAAQQQKTGGVLYFQLTAELLELLRIIQP